MHQGRPHEEVGPIVKPIGAPQVGPQFNPNPMGGETTQIQAPASQGGNQSVVTPKRPELIADTQRNLVREQEQQGEYLEDMADDMFMDQIISFGANIAGTLANMAAPGMGSLISTGLNAGAQAITMTNDPKQPTIETAKSAQLIEDLPANQSLAGRIQTRDQYSQQTQLQERASAAQKEMEDLQDSWVKYADMGLKIAQGTGLTHAVTSTDVWGEIPALGQLGPAPKGLWQNIQEVYPNAQLAPAQKTNLDRMLDPKGHTGGMVPPKMPGQNQMEWNPITESYTPRLDAEGNPIPLEYSSQGHDINKFMGGLTEDIPLARRLFGPEGALALPSGIMPQGEVDALGQRLGDIDPMSGNITPRYEPDMMRSQMFQQPLPDGGGSYLDRVKEQFLPTLPPGAGGDYPGQLDLEMDIREPTGPGSPRPPGQEQGALFPLGDPLAIAKRRQRLYAGLY